MIDLINQRIAATESTTSQLKQLVNDAAQQVEDSIMKHVEALLSIAACKHISSNTENRRTNNILRYASLTAIMIGGISWFVTAALWSKILTISGGAGLTYSFFRKDFSKCKPQPQSEALRPAKVTISDSFIAGESSCLINELKKVSDLWADFSESNRSILVSAIRNPSLNLSANDRFKIESLIRVSKTLSFPLIEYRNILEDASTLDKFKETVNRVARLAIDEIDKVSSYQIFAYKEMCKLIGTTFC